MTMAITMIIIISGYEKVAEGLQSGKLQKVFENLDIGNANQVAQTSF